MDREFPDSKSLAVLLKWYNWALYDITTSLANPYSPSLEEIAFDEATRYEYHHRYLLLPIPQEKETLQKTYSSLRTKQIHPVMRIPALLSKDEKEFNIRAEDGFKDDKFNCYYLNEFYFQEDELYTSNSLFFSTEYNSRLAIPLPHVLEVFSRYFCLIQFTDKGTVIKKPAHSYADIN